MKELSLHIMDLVQNSIAAAATNIAVFVEEDSARGTLLIRIRDDGRGMDQDLVSKVASPFVTSRSTRKVGLGIPLFKENAEMTGGSFSLQSKEGEGTQVEAVFGLRHIDRVPMGDLAGTMLLLVTGNPALDFQLTVRVDENEFDFDTREIRQVLGEEIPLDTPEVSQWMMDSLTEGIQSLHGGM